MNFRDFIQNDICESTGMTASDLKYHLQMKLDELNYKPDWIKNVKFLKRKNEFNLITSIGLTESVLVKCLDGTGITIENYSTMKSLGVTKVNWTLKP